MDKNTEELSPVEAGSAAFLETCRLQEQYVRQKDHCDEIVEEIELKIHNTLRETIKAIHDIAPEVANKEHLYRIFSDIKIRPYTRCLTQITQNDSLVSEVSLELRYLSGEGVLPRVFAKGCFPHKIDLKIKHNDTFDDMESIYVTMGDSFSVISLQGCLQQLAEQMGRSLAYLFVNP